MKNKILALLIAASCLFSVSVPAFAEPINSTATDVQTVSPSGVASEYEVIAENSNYVLYAEKKTGKIALKVKSNNYIWYSNPADSENDNLAGGEMKKRIDSQLVIYYTQGYSEVVTNSATGSVSRGGLKNQKVDNGIKFSYEFKNAGFTVPVQYILEDDGLRAEVLIQDITPDVVTRQETVAGSKEKFPVDYNITKIDFLQYFGTGLSDEEGYMFVPEGSGGIINFSNGKVNYKNYQAPIYGQYMDQESMRDLTNDYVRMPVYGIKKDGNAFLTIIEENEGIGMINAAISGRDTTYNAVFPTIYHKVIDFTAGTSRTQPLSESLATKGDFSMKFHFLTDDKANYNEMAKVYQDYLINEKGMDKTESSDKNELYLEVYGGVERKTSIAGIVRRILQPLATYEDVQVMAQHYIDSGIDDLVIKYNDWTKNSDRKKAKTSTSFDSSLGGKKDFKQLIKFTKDNNIAFYPSINFNEYSKTKFGYSNVFDAAKAPNQSPAYIRAGMVEEDKYGRRWSMLKPDKVEEASDKFMADYKKLGLGGISLEYLGEKVYSDNTKGGIKRSQTIDIWSDIIENYDENVGNVLLQNANTYAIPYAEHIMDAPISEYGNELIDENIPFYQMAIHGFVSYSSPAINLASDWQKTMLKAIETGSCLKFTLLRQNADILMDSYYNDLYSCDFNIWFGKSVEEYNRAAVVLDKVAGKKMIGHSKIADGVYETIYEGGIKTIVNYNDEAVTTNNGMVNAADFILVK